MSLHSMLVGYLPRYAPIAAKLPWLLNLRDLIPGAAKFSEAIAGFSARRELPKWRNDIFREPAESTGSAGKEIVFFADTFNRYFERENLDDALKVLRAANYTIHFASHSGERPLCCGRTFLSVGRVDLAREEAERTLNTLKPFIERGVPVVGLEPSCMFGFRDEIPAILKSVLATKLAKNSFLLEEFLAREHENGSLDLPLQPLGKPALLHGHCHQKSFGAMSAVEKTLRLVPDIQLETVESSCCGMAGSFGYGADTIDVSLAMGELSLLPAVRKAANDAIIVADGTSCRQQIHDGTGREAVHVARVLARSLKNRS
jgi:Fe-S oxidoreductase